MKNSYNTGFTLVEILIVVAIIAILIGIGVPKLLDAKANAHATKRSSVVSAVSLAKERYVLKNTDLSPYLTGTNDDRFTLVKDYIDLHNISPADLTELISGTGRTVFLLGNIDDPATVGTDELESPSFP